MSSGHLMVDVHTPGEDREKDLPLISVGLPTFNRAGSLERAIESVLAQDYANIELVISDNASSDDTQALCADCCGRDKRIKYIHQAVNRGAHANFLTVLNESHGEYFMWLGDDDWLHKSYISRCSEKLIARHDMSLVCGIAKYYDGDRLAFNGVRIDLLQDSPTERVLAFYRQVSDNGTFYGIVRRELLLANPMQKSLGSDWRLIAALALKGKILTLEDVIVLRSRDGVSANLKALAVDSGLSKREAEMPYQRIATDAFRDIAFASPTFAELGALARWSLACKVYLVCYHRFLVNENPLVIWANRVRYRLKLRTRLKRALRID